MKDVLLRKAGQLPKKVAGILHCDDNSNFVVIKGDSKDNFSVKFTVVSSEEQERRRNSAYRYFSID
jgi:hypothetical protein